MRRIGVLVLMHDKDEALNDWRQALGAENGFEWFHPQTHPLHQPNAAIQPLALTHLERFDGFVITGAPIDRLEFEDVHYYAEVCDLIMALRHANVPVLFSCWGAMAALHHQFGLNKTRLDHKLFGVYPHRLLHATALTAGLADGFMAPHARYVDLSPHAFNQSGTPQLLATTQDGLHPLLAVHPGYRQTYLFAHLEYRRLGLWQEHQRETNGPKPLHDDARSWPWQGTQRQFFENWLASLA